MQHRAGGRSIAPPSALIVEGWTDLGASPPAEAERIFSSPAADGGGNGGAPSYGNWEEESRSSQTATSRRVAVAYPGLSSQVAQSPRGGDEGEAGFSARGVRPIGARSSQGGMEEGSIRMPQPIGVIKSKALAARPSSSPSSEVRPTPTVTGTPGVSQTWWDTNERTLFWVLIGLAFISRFYRLDVPSGVVFDETHFGRFTNQYHANTYLFDIHPPLGKLIFWLISSLFGYDYTKCRFVNITDAYGEGCHFIILRIVAASFGTALIPVVYKICRNFGSSVPAALFCGFLVITDNLNLGEARLILMDSQLMFWIAFSLLQAQRWWKALNDQTDAEADFLGKYGLEYNANNPAHRATDPRFLSIQQHLYWLAWIGFTCGMAVSIKWTGLATPAMIAVESFFALCFLKRPVRLQDGIVIAGTAFVTYAAWFYWHFALLWRTGDGDGFMRLEFQRTLVNNTYYDPNAPKQPFLVSFFQLNREMLLANARISQRHHWESMWWEWPLNLRGILYYSKDAGFTYTTAIYLLGNPLVIWLVLGCLVLAAGFMVIYWRYRRFGGISTPQFAMLNKWTPLFTRISFCLAAYVFNLAPYLAVTRSCFAYHYMPALLYGEIVAALLIDAMAGRKHIGKVLLVLGTIITCAFLFFAPWVYGFALTSEGHARRRWLPRWD